jgi:hypothetical protein
MFNISDKKTSKPTKPPVRKEEKPTPTPFRDGEHINRQQAPKPDPRPVKK